MLYADIVTIFSIEVYSFYLCAALLLHTSSIILSCSALVLLVNDLIMLGTSIWLFRHLEHQNLSSNSWDNALVPFLAIREAVALLANDPMMSGTFIQSFRHLKQQTLFTSDDFICSNEILFFSLLTTRRAVASLKNYISCLKTDFDVQGF